MIHQDWRFPEPDNIERLESVATRLLEMLELVQASLGLLLAGTRERHGRKAYRRMIRRMHINKSNGKTLIDAYQRLREQIDIEASEALGAPCNVVSFSLPLGDLADDFREWIGLYRDRISPKMLAGVLDTHEIEELLPVLHEWLAESELRETIDQKKHCYFCGDGFYEPEEPCQICSDHLKTGCILIGVENGETAKARRDRKHLPKRIGRCFPVSREFIRKYWPKEADAILADRGMYIDEDDAKQLGLEP